MKTIALLALTLAAAFGAAAQNSVTVQTKFIEHPADVALTKEPETQRGVDVLTAPKASTASGRVLVVSVTDDSRVPAVKSDGEEVLKNGPELMIRPTVDGDRITFRAVATVRVPEGVQAVSGGQVSEFSSREYYFTGSAKSGETVVVTSKGVHNDKRVSFALTLTKE